MQEPGQPLTPLLMFSTFFWPTLLFTNVSKLRLMVWATMSWILPHKYVSHILMPLCRSYFDQHQFLLLKKCSCSHEGLRLLPPVLSGVQRAADKGSGGKMAGSM